ncbi:MAG: type I 3-dehydroquinate dehydratase [Candidatus Gracilibacteria bacterium]
MKSKHVLPIQVESFAMLVKCLRATYKKADIFEVWIDRMRVKGDLKVIARTFKKPFLGKSESLDLLKRAATAGMKYVDVPHNLKIDQEFTTLVKNKGTRVIRSYHNFKKTPARAELLKILAEMDKNKPDLLKIATQVNSATDGENLLGLLTEKSYKNRLIIAGMGARARAVRVKAPLLGSVFYYAPLVKSKASASGQLTKTELEKEWAKI